MARGFKGGIRPNDSKTRISSIPIHELDGTAEHVYPLRQHIGAMLESAVEVGECVLVGQKIADLDELNPPLFASVSGKVSAIEPRLHPDGSMVRSIIIENDMRYEVHGSVCPKGKLKELSPQDIIHIVREAGIVGMGGECYPTHIKLQPQKDKEIDCVIINGTECEPYLTGSYRLMLESPELLVYGMRAVMRVFGLSKGHIAIEADKRAAIKAVKTKLAGKYGIKINKLRTRYPQGSEKHLIYAVTGREIPHGKTPADVGVVVINADTAAAIATAIKTGMPLIRRTVTVAGTAIAKPANFNVRLGASFEYLVEKAGGFKGEPTKVIMGGPMRGIAQSCLQVPVVKGTSAVLVFGESSATHAGHKMRKRYNPRSGHCVRCGKCADVCPMRLMPMNISLYAQRIAAAPKESLEMCEKYGADDCMECGACSYMCPGQQHPLKFIRVAKKAMAEKQPSAENQQIKE